MTFQISKHAGRIILFAVCLLATTGSTLAQQESQMSSLINQSLSKLKQYSPEAHLNCIAELKRIEVMYPDSVQPKYQLTLQSLNYAVQHPHDEQTKALIDESEQTIRQLDTMKGADPSDVCTLRGYYYMVLVVQNPAQNGPRYYQDVLSNLEKALKLNPDNILAQRLQQMFREGMRRETGR